MNLHCVMCCSLNAVAQRNDQSFQSGVCSVMWMADYPEIHLVQVKSNLSIRIQMLTVHNTDWTKPVTNTFSKISLFFSLSLGLRKFWHPPWYEGVDTSAVQLYHVCCASLLHITCSIHRNLQYLTLGMTVYRQWTPH